MGMGRGDIQREKHTEHRAHCTTGRKQLDKDKLAEHMKEHAKFNIWKSWIRNKRN